MRWGFPQRVCAPAIAKPRRIAAGGSLFQLLKYFPGRLEPTGPIVIPTLAVLALLLLPFVDRSTTRAARARRPVMLVGAAFRLRRRVLMRTGCTTPSHESF